MIKMTSRQSPLTSSSDLDRTKSPVADTGQPAGARKTKAALVRELVSAPGGASLSQLVTATGWQAHTLRAALSGLRKAGLSIERRREGDATIYRAVSPAMDGAQPIAPSIAPIAPLAEGAS